VIDPPSRAEHTACVSGRDWQPSKVTPGLRVPLRHPLPPPLLPKCLKETKRALVPAGEFFLAKDSSRFSTLAKGMKRSKPDVPVVDDSEQAWINKYRAAISEPAPKPIFKRMVGRLGYLVGIVLGKANGSSLVNKTVGSLPLRNLQRVLLKRFAAASFKADLNWNSLQGCVTSICRSNCFRQRFIEVSQRNRVPVSLNARCARAHP